MSVIDVVNRKTSDLGFAAFLKTRGLKVSKFGRSKQRFNEYFFEFEDPDNIFDQLNVDYENSPEKDFDDKIRGLKKMANRSKRKDDSDERGIKEE